MNEIIIGALCPAIGMIGPSFVPKLRYGESVNDPTASIEEKGWGAKTAFVRNSIV